MKKILTILFFILCSIFAKSQTKKIVWIPWEKISLATKNELKKIKYDKVESVYSQILLDIKESKETETNLDVSIAVIDLDGDGKLGYAVGYSGSLFCGSAGCDFSVYENDGKKRLNLTDVWEKIKPAKNGIISSRGKFFPLEKVQ